MGYLYNLNLGLKKNKYNNIEFLSGNEEKSKFRFFYDKSPDFVKEYYRTQKRLQDCKFLLSDKRKYSNYNLSKYDYIHFHSTFDMFRIKDSLENFKGKIIITSHSPKPAHIEMIEDNISECDREKYIEYYKKLSIVDEYAFNRADYIVFPCEDAEEPYYNRWEKYKQIKEVNKNKYRYILSGIEKCSAKIDTLEMRKRYNIPKDAFLISYVGRHNETKGYDILKEIGKVLLEKYSNVYFICAGTETPLVGLENERWIETGWTNDPHSIIASSELFILPNKETYFDLVLLEVLSLSIPVLLSNTGGNKYFKKFNSSGIQFFDNVCDAINKIDLNLELPKELLKSYGKFNKKIFDQNFDEVIFAKEYIKLIDSLD